MIENEILEFLRGENDCDHLNLLRAAREEIIRLRARVSDLGWAVQYEQERADAFTPVGY